MSASLTDTLTASHATADEVRAALVVVAQIRSEAQAIADRFAKSGRHSNSVCSRCDECQAYAHARRILALTGDDTEEAT